MEILSHIAMIEAALLLGLGAYVVHVSPKARANLLFGLLALVQVSWLVGFGLLVRATDRQTAWLWYRAGAVGWCFGPVVVWHFVAALTGQTRLFERPWRLLAAYAPAAVLFGRQLTNPVFAVELVPTALGWDERVALDNPWTYAAVAQYVGFSISALWWVHRWGRGARLPARARQARVILATGVATLVAVSVTNVVPRFLDVHTMPGIAPLIVPIWVLGLWTTVGKHQLRVLSPEAAAGRVLRAMADTVLLLSPRDVVLQANRAAESLFGVEADALVGRRLSEFLPGQPDTAMRRRVTGGTMFRSEVSLERKGTARKTLSVTAALVTDDSGEILGTAMILRDISERKRWERALREREEHFRGLIENVADIILIVDVEGVIHYASPSFERLHCNGPAAAAGTSLIDRLHEEDRERFRERALRPAARGEGANRVEARCGRPDGSWRVLEVVSAPLQESTGPAILVSARDVTERKEMEARLAQTEREQLESQLVQANRLASAGLLAASVSHEINNPLTLVIGNLELAADRVRRLASAGVSIGPPASAAASRATGIERSTPDAVLASQRLADIERWIRDAIAGGWRIEQIVSDLRSFARGGANDAGPVDVNEVVERTTGLAAARIERNAELVRELGAIPKARASEGLVGQVLLNLLLNALHAVDSDAPSRPKIVVRTFADETDVVMEVEDTGRGITDEQRARIFEPFYTTKPVGQGSGLGLWVARHVVQAWKGSIEARSEVGVGSTFTVRIPRADRPADEDDPDADAAAVTTHTTDHNDAAALRWSSAPVAGESPRTSGYPELDRPNGEALPARRRGGSSSDAA